MKKYSANYSHSNHNFVIQNITEEKRINNKYLPAICIVKNILQRGKPTLLSKFLQKHIGSIHKDKKFLTPYPLISNEIPIWERIIKGNNKNNYFPAKRFFEELIPKYLSDYMFIQQLIIPEVPINIITQNENNEFQNQQVDFYLPQAHLIIEIDGSQHQINLNKDKYRDQYVAKYGINTIRINTIDLDAENETFKANIATIKKHIEKVICNQEKRRSKDFTFISIKDYQKAYIDGIDLLNSNYKATAIIRFQIFILELLDRGLLDFSNKWQIELLSEDINNFADLAIQDLFLWFNHIFKLQKISWNQPEYLIKQIDSKKNFSNSKTTIKVDFSLLKRYTDEFQVNSEIFFIRNDYLEEYLYFKNSNSIKPSFIGYIPYDYFEISTAETIKYKLKIGGENSDEISLLFLLENIFLQDAKDLKFNEGQLPIIINALSKNDTIGLLPTGKGKSVCYQLVTLLQPAISFVVCPIKALMYDQKADLDNCLFTRINHITSDDDGEDKEKIQYEFSNGKYHFIFISPERFQIKKFRQYLSSVNQKYNIAYAIIDEVHCISEWGHDFRTAYLNLSNTIQKLCSNYNFIGLTATASINVLKDIQIEFGIKQENIKTPIDYTRKELDFEVINDEHNKLLTLKDLIEQMQVTEQVLTPNGDNSKCGIIFTPNVNGNKGCYQLSVGLSVSFASDINYYSGSVPKNKNQQIMNEKKFDEYKQTVQKNFKKNEFTLLVATKAFGMGVNKPNIHYTIHYGIPSSMESLYQEGGRAGRDNKIFKNKQAKCYVLLSKSTKHKDFLNQIWIRETQLSKLNELKKEIDGDLNTNLFLFSSSLDIIKNEFKRIKDFFEKYAISNKKNIRVEGEDINSDKAQTEKVIYRLYQLGIIEDWTIENFFGGGVFFVDFANFDDKSITKALLKTINKYDPDFSYEIINRDSKYSNYREIINASEKYTDFDKNLWLLLQWSYDNYAYNRKQSLKNIYENCCDFSEGIINKDDFKTRLENYFKFNQTSYLLQHIAENPNDYEKWFEVFYQVENNIFTDIFLNLHQREALRDNLSRFLESYMYNVGLDLISGLLRLWLDDYDNIDGRKRLEKSLESIQYLNKHQIVFIITHIFKIGKQMNNKNKDFLASSLLKFFNDEAFLYLIFKELEDSFSLSIILEKANKKLKLINGRIYDKFRKIG